MGTPIGALASGEASDVTLRTLFVAACRSLGVAARLCPADGRAEVLRGGSWACVEGAEAAERTVELRVVAPEGRSLAYGTDWGLARLGTAMQAGGEELRGFHQLELWGCDPDALEVPAGTYRLTATTRLPNGNQQASELVFDVTGPTEVALRLREPAPDDMLQRIPLPDALGPSRRDDGGLELLAFLELAEEPTEHLLNELADGAEQVAAAGLAVTLVTREEPATAQADPTLARALAALRAAGADAALARDDFSELPERLARRMFANPELLPLAVLLDRRGLAPDDAPTGLFARGGYAVGTVDLVLRLAALA